MGLKDLVLDLGSRELKQCFEDQVAHPPGGPEGGQPRPGFSDHFLSLRNGGKPGRGNRYSGHVVAKYASVVVLSDFKGESLFPLLLERLNIFTDPQRPMTVTQGIYEIGAPG
jgi:acetyl-CoA decarbonylase/synthase, CODH/ACS complex subunit gamma